MDIRLFLNKIYWALMKKSGVKAGKKSYEYWLAKGYTNAPGVSFIIQSHNKSLQVKHIVKKLRQWPGAEIIVIDDGSDLGHIRALARCLQGANEFVIRANDLYENVMYDKAIRFSNGKYIALLQDDDDFDTLDWVRQALAYFGRYPRLAILGGNNGHDFAIDEARQFGMGVPYEHPSATAFQFVHTVDRAPMWLNRALFDEHLGHIDFSFAPFQFDDCELCLRAWLNGLQVGWYPSGFKSLTAGGMRIWNTSFTGTQCRRNAALLYKLYRDKKEAIDKRVAEARNQA